MKKHLNTLYVTTQGAWLGVEGETVVVKVENAVKLRVPLHMLDGIVAFGNVSLSPFLMGRCSERGVTVSFLTERGRFLARVEGPVSGNVLLRRTQYRWADDPGKSAGLARTFVCAKIANCRRVLQRAARDHGSVGEGGAGLKRVIHSLKRCFEEVNRAQNLEDVRGFEGQAAQEYFSVFNRAITVGEVAFHFAKRSRRPPMDPVNALLSFLYTLLLHDTRSALESVGLDPQVGFLHRDRPGRPSLALDMMEEFRPFLADRVVLSLINRRQVTAESFVVRETGGVIMDDDARKTVLKVYQERKAEEIQQPFLGEKTTVGRLVHIQSLLLARHLRGDLDGYPAFLWK